MSETGQQLVEAPPKREEVVREASRNALLRFVDFCRKPVQQRVFVLVVLGTAFAVQYRLVNMTVADVKDTQKLAPASINAIESSVGFLDPETEPGEFSFGYQQVSDQHMIVDAYFDKAALSEETLQNLAALGV